MFNTVGRTCPGMIRVCHRAVEERSWFRNIPCRLYVNLVGIDAVDPV